MFKTKVGVLKFIDFSSFIENVSNSLSIKINNCFDDRVKDKEMDDFDSFCFASVSNDALSFINRIADISIDNSCIELLDINEENAKEAFFYTEDKVKLHEYNTFYIPKKNQIVWSGLIDKIYQNSVNDECERDGIKYYALSKQEITNVLNVMAKLQEQVLFDFPLFDVAELACKLENMSFLCADTDRENGDYYILASTISDRLVFYPFHFQDSLLKRQANIAHEGFHIFEGVCIDYEQNLPDSEGVLTGGVSVQNSMYKIDNDSNSLVYDKYYDSRYCFSFLSEIYAELYTKNLFHSEKKAYLNFQGILDLLQMSLALNSYRIDTFLENILYKDPQSFIRNFPIFGEDKTKSFLDNLKMLVQIECVLMGLSDKLKEDIEYHGISEEACLATMMESSIIAVEKIFYSNLIILNENKNLALEDNLYFLKLFEDKKKKVCQNMILENKARGNINYSIQDSLFKPVVSPMFFISQYLGSHYGIPIEKLNDALENHRYSLDYTFSNVFSDITKQNYFSSMVSEMIENQDMKYREKVFSKEKSSH